MPQFLLAIVAFSIALVALSSGPACAAPPNPAARELAAAAFTAHDAADYARAADLYFQAHQLDPADGAFLFASARSLQLGGQWALAIVRYRAFLHIEAANPAYLARARGYLAECETRQRAALESQRTAELARAATASEGPSGAIPAQAALPPPRRPWRTAALWSGSAVGVGGAAWLAAATWQRQTFEAAMAAGFAGGQVDGYASRAEAHAKGHAIAAQQTWAWAVLSVGVTAAIAAWWWPEPHRQAP